MEKITIYTDGSSKGNPGNGGYGVVMRFKHYEKILSEGFKLTTNNRMELLAVITALENIKNKKVPVIIYSDSKYVIDAINKGWVFNWEKNDFKKKKNKDLWLRFLAVYNLLDTVTFIWVKGHAGNTYNERCDKLAVNAACKKTLKTDHFFEKNIHRSIY